jgi:amidase
MTPGEYLSHDATALAALVARGEVTGDELLSLALGRAERLNPAINAICRLMQEPARQQLSGSLVGALAGVPMLIKDAVQDYEGWPTSYGSRAFANTPAKAHSHIVRRLLGAGAVIFGKTNTPELALKGVTDPKAFGRTNNPWNLAHTPGGSSGGSAAAVAAGIVPMAAGNDGGGSIRIPAACCALFGLRPSRGRISVGPGMGEVWDGASSDGVLSRSVRDTALALDVLSGPARGDPYVIAPPAAPFTQLAQRDPGRLRIGFTTTSPIGTPVHAEAVKAVRDAAALLGRLGHDVVEGAPEVNGADLARSFVQLYFDHVSAVVSQARRAGAKTGDFELLTRVIAAFGRATSAQTSTLARLRRNDFAQAVATFHRRHDLLLTPTLAHPPVRHGQGDPPAWQEGVLSVLLATGLLGALARWGLLDSTIDQIARDNLSYVPFTQLANLTGLPAMSVPLHWTADGLPLGVQFVARFGNEATLLQLATQLERAQPWFARLAPMAREGT